MTTSTATTATQVPAFLWGVKPDMEMTAAAKIFHKTWEAIKTEIPFNPLWKNGTGYLDAGCWLDLQPAGQKTKGIDDFGRRFILIGTPIGNVVLFHRYSDSPNTIISNWPSVKLQMMFGVSGSMNQNEVERVLGVYSPNVGLLLNSVIEDIEDFKEDNGGVLIPSKT